MWLAFIAEDNDPRNNPSEPWLQEVIKLADEVMARIMKEVKEDGYIGSLRREERQMASLVSSDA